MQNSDGSINRPVNRRSFLKTGMLAGSAASVGAGLIGSLKPAFGQSSGLTKGDVAILRMLAAAELIEADLWTQYAELGGIGDNPPIEVAPNQQLNSYQAALSNLDSDGPQYITSNTLDEVSHADFLNGYLESKGAEPVNFDEFRTLQGSTATGAQNIGRLTLHAPERRHQLVHPLSQHDESGFWRDVSASHHNHQPHRDPQDRCGLQRPVDHIQVIANTAAFHFGYIEQGGRVSIRRWGRKRAAGSASHHAGHRRRRSCALSGVGGFRRQWSPAACRTRRRTNGLTFP